MLLTLTNLLRIHCRPQKIGLVVVVVIVVVFVCASTPNPLVLLVKGGGRLS